jgi:tryptophan halogenase
MLQHRAPKAPRSAVERIVIVGGGTSGWLSAAFLSHMCGPDMLGRFDITLVESQDIGNIGVGEATIPTLRQTLQKVGLTEREFFRHCNASFKLGIKFVDWHRKPDDGAEDVFWNPFGTLPTAWSIPADWHRKPDDGAEDVFWNPFGTLPTAWSIPAMNFWLASVPGESPAHFTDLFTAHTALAKAMKAPKAADSNDFDGLVAYAYHMDTHLFGRLLRERAMERGVKRILDKVVAVERDDRGWIERLRLQEGEALSADLFIDCSGFRSLLLQQGLEEPFHSFEDSLLCDSAIAISQPWPEHRAAMRPYTTATAMDHGWAWNIPLYSREASGYVYSAKHTDAEQAEREFRRLVPAPNRR